MTTTFSHICGSPKTAVSLLDGDGMIHSVYFENGKAEYRNKYIRTDDYQAEVAGRCEAGGVLLPATLDR
ncbi:MAG: carotenoid oxygenase family protein, partial [Pseudomonadota bacterium]